MGAVRALRKAEAIAADDDAIPQRDPVPDAAEFADHRMGVRIKIVADNRAFIKDHVRMQNCISRSQRFPDHRECPNGGVLADRAESATNAVDGRRSWVAAAGKTVRAPGRNRDRGWSK